MDRWPILFGDPFHVDNLTCQWASNGAFGPTEQDNHLQRHHHQLLQSIFDVVKGRKPLAQAVMDKVLEGAAGDKIIIKVAHERQQHWNVNQELSKRYLKWLKVKTSDGRSALLVWLMHMHRLSDDWQRRMRGLSDHVEHARDHCWAFV